MLKEGKKLRSEIRKLMKAARAQDDLDDQAFGPDFRGDELPEELSRRKSRLAKIKEAKERLEARKEPVVCRRVQLDGAPHPEHGRFRLRRQRVVGEYLQVRLADADLKSAQPLSAGPRAIEALLARRLSGWFIPTHVTYYSAARRGGKRRRGVTPRA